jgi:thiol-disulfide isomerase/thioredoxin
MTRPALLSLLLFIAALPARAELTRGTPAPDFPRGVRWLPAGTRPLSMRDLKGRVVIVDFWEYTCINCIRTFPHLKEWYRRYHGSGLEIVGVHKGEFEFASDPENVERAYRRFALPYPAIADTRSEIWRAYDCNSWPDTFIIDRSGVIREAHRGEGDYGSEERLLQDLLKQGHKELDFSSFTIPEDHPIVGNACGDVSPEIYVGAARGALWGGRIANPEGFYDGRVVDYKPIEIRVVRGFFARGPWKNRPDDFEAAADPTPARPVSLGISYRGREVYAVLDRATREPVDVEITENGAPIPAAQRGKDVRALPDGRTVVTIGEPRMYYLIVDEDDTATHELVLQPMAKGARICSFTFSNRCLLDFDRL